MNKITSLLTVAVVAGLFSAQSAMADHHADHKAGDKKEHNGCKGKNGCKGDHKTKKEKKETKTTTTTEEHAAPAEGTGH